MELHTIMQIVKLRHSKYANDFVATGRTEAALVIAAAALRDLAACLGWHGLVEAMLKDAHDMHSERDVA